MRSDDNIGETPGRTERTASVRGGGLLVRRAHHVRLSHLVGGTLAVFVAFGATVGHASLSAGDAHVCAVDAAGEVTCWGANGAGQLGMMAWGEAQGPTGLVVPGVAGAAEVVAIPEGACVRHEGGQVTCWGRDGEAVTWNNDPASFAPRPLPPRSGAMRGARTRLPAVDGATRLAAGRTTRCLLHASGGVACWSAEAGPLTVAPGVEDGAALAVGDGWACAARPGPGDIRCWGTRMPAGVPASDPTAWLFVERDRLRPHEAESSRGARERPGATRGTIEGLGVVEALYGAGSTLCARLEGGRMRCNVDPLASSGQPASAAAPWITLDGDRVGLAASGLGACVAAGRAARCRWVTGDAPEGEEVSLTLDGEVRDLVVGGGHWPLFAPPFACARLDDPDASIVCWGPGAHRFREPGRRGAGEVAEDTAGGALRGPVETEATDEVVHLQPGERVAPRARAVREALTGHEVPGPETCPTSVTAGPDEAVGELVLESFGFERRLRLPGAAGWRRALGGREVLEIHLPGATEGLERHHHHSWHRMVLIAELPEGAEPAAGSRLPVHLALDHPRELRLGCFSMAAPVAGWLEVEAYEPRGADGSGRLRARFELRDGPAALGRLKGTLDTRELVPDVRRVAGPVRGWIQLEPDDPRRALTRGIAIEDAVRGDLELHIESPTSSFWGRISDFVAAPRVYRGTYRGQALIERVEATPDGRVRGRYEVAPLPDEHAPPDLSFFATDEPAPPERGRPIFVFDLPRVVLPNPGVVSLSPAPEPPAAPRDERPDPPPARPVPALVAALEAGTARSLVRSVWGERPTLRSLERTRERGRPALALTTTVESEDEQEGAAGSGAFSMDVDAGSTPELVDSRRLVVDARTLAPIRQEWSIVARASDEYPDTEDDVDPLAETTHVEVRYSPRHVDVVAHNARQGRHRLRLPRPPNAFDALQRQELMATLPLAVAARFAFYELETYRYYGLDDLDRSEQHLIRLDVRFTPRVLEVVGERTLSGAAGRREVFEVRITGDDSEFYQSGTYFLRRQAPHVVVEYDRPGTVRAREVVPEEAD